MLIEYSLNFIFPLLFRAYLNRCTGLLSVFSYAVRFLEVKRKNSSDHQVLKGLSKFKGINVIMITFYSICLESYLEFALTQYLYMLLDLWRTIL